MKCVLERMRSPVSRALRISRWTTRRDKPEWEKEKYRQPLRSLLAEPEYLLYFWLGRMHGNILCLFATDSCPVKMRETLSEWISSDDPCLMKSLNKLWSWAKSTDLHMFLCLRLTTPSIHFTSKCCHLRLTNWSSMILLHFDQIVNWKGLLKLEFRLMKAWIDGDFPCWMGKRRCWIDYRWRVLEIALLVWAVMNPIHFEVWVETGVLQILHVQTRFGWYQIECGPATKD